MSGIFTVLIALGLWQPARDISTGISMTGASKRNTLALIAHAQARGYLKRDDPMVEAKAKLKWMLLTQHNSGPLSAPPRALGEDDLRGEAMTMDRPGKIFALQQIMAKVHELAALAWPDATTRGGAWSSLIDIQSAPQGRWITGRPRSAHRRFR